MPGRRSQDGWEATSLLSRFVSFGLGTGQLGLGWRHDDSAVYQVPSSLGHGIVVSSLFFSSCSCFFTRHVDVNGLYDHLPVEAAAHSRVHKNDNVST